MWLFLIQKTINVRVLFNVSNTNKIIVIYTEISATKTQYTNKVSEIVNFLEKYNFDHVKTFKMPILGFLSGLKGSDHVFVHKDI